MTIVSLTTPLLLTVAPIASSRIISVLRSQGALHAITCIALAGSGNVLNPLPRAKLIAGEPLALKGLLLNLVRILNFIAVSLSLELVACVVLLF